MTTQQKQNTILVYAATVDRDKVVLFHDRTSTLLNQGDPRIPVIIEILKRENFSYQNPVQIDLTLTDPRGGLFNEFSTKNPFVKFYRIAKETLKGIFTQNIPEADTGAYGQKTPTPGGIENTEKGEAETAQKYTQAAAISAIQAMAVPVTCYLEDSTVVAVVNNTAALPNVENISQQIQHSLDNNSKGAACFFERMAKVANLRQHSAEDLMKFLQAGDLPLTEDGSIIAYKVLQSCESGDCFVDVYTKKVTQRVGDRVMMCESLVDSNRARTCSHGLHVARVDYIPSFSGTDVFIIRINPEDVIAVPYEDGSKMRVRAYEIIMQLPADVYALLNRRKNILEHPQGADILKQVLTPGFMPPSREVEITGGMGTGIMIRELGTAVEPAGPAEATEPTEPVKPVEPVAAILAPVDLSNKEQAAPVVDPASLVDEEKDGTKKPKKQKPRQMKAAKLLEKLHTAINSGKGPKIKAAAIELQAFKKTSKVSWNVLYPNKNDVALIVGSIQRYNAK